jgi:hypothetical protein
METTYYTLTAREIMVTGDAVEKVSGGARQLVCVRKAARPVEDTPAQGKVIDFAAWKADREEEARLEEEWYEGVDEALEQPTVYEPRPRRDHKRTVLIGGEFFATLSVIGVMAILAVRLFAM